MTAGFASHIRRGSRLLIIDLDEKNGRDGFPSFGYQLLDGDIEMPKEPVVQTPHNGHHIYLRLPRRGPKIVTEVNVWDGVDVITVGGQAILAGTKTTDGDYELINGNFAEIPEAGTLVSTVSNLLSN